MTKITFSQGPGASYLDLDRRFYTKYRCERGGVDAIVELRLRTFFRRGMLHVFFIFEGIVHVKGVGRWRRGFYTIAADENVMHIPQVDILSVF